MSFIPCAVCGKQKTHVVVEYVCDDPSCIKAMREKHSMALLPSAPMTKVRMFPQRQKYAEKMTDNWKGIADATGFNYDGTMKV